MNLAGTGLEALRKSLNERDSSEVPTEEIVRVAYFVLKKKLF